MLNAEGLNDLRFTSVVYGLFTVSSTMAVLQDVICDSVYLAAHSGA